MMTVMEELIEDGREEGREEGRKQQLKKSVIALLRQGKLNLSEIADVEQISINEVRKIAKEMENGK